MNIKKMQETIIGKYAKQMAELKDGTAFGFVVGQLAALEAKGEDPTQYEVIFVTDENPKHTEDGYKITSRIRLVKVLS